MVAKKHLIRFILTGRVHSSLWANPPLQRDWGGSCRDRLESARARIVRDIARHGENSHQVRNDQERLENVRRWCRDHHGDWDHARFDVGLYIRP